MQVKCTCLLFALFLCCFVKFSDCGKPRGGTSHHSRTRPPSFNRHPTFPSRPSTSSIHTSVRRTTLSPRRPFPTRPTPSPPRTQPTRPRPTRPNPTHPIPTRSQPTRPRPTRPNPTYPVPTPSSPTRPRPTRPNPTYPVPTPSSPTRPRPTRPNPTLPIPTRPTPTRPNPTHPIPTRPQPTRPTPTLPIPTRPIPTNTSPTRPRPTRPNPTYPVPTPSNPTRPWPTRPNPTPPIPTRPTPTRPVPTRPKPTPIRPVKTVPTVGNTPKPLPTFKTPPNIGWNKDILKPNQNFNVKPVESDPNHPWGVPGRESPYQKAKFGNLQSPPNGGAIGFKPEIVNNKKVVGQQQAGPQSTYPKQEYGPVYQPGYIPGTYGYQPHFGNTGPKTTIINNNYYKTVKYQPPPVYYPKYYYSNRDTGDTSLGLYLGYSLGRISTPTYHYHGHVHHTYRPVYDHYTVHHYHHNVQSAPKQEVVQPNAIVECVGDSGTICPTGTHALCTTNGTIMCVAGVAQTQPCTDLRQANCTKSLVPCWNSTAAECRGKTPQESVFIDIPCMYTTKVMGNITYVNNSIVLVPPPPSPAPNETSSWLTTTPTSVWSVSTQYPITTTPSPFSVPRVKRQLLRPQEQQFCVAIIAQPAERKILTESEILFQNTKSIFTKFLTRAIGANRNATDF